MTDTERYRNVVLGSGEAGKYLAWHLARQGEQTVLVERRWVGGSCPNVNCLPSKNEVWSAMAAHLVRGSAAFGVVTSGVAIDMAKVLARKRGMVDGLLEMHLERFRTSGAELVMGDGRFVAPKTLEVRLNSGGTRLLAADRVFVNVGTHATIPPVPGLQASGPLTHIEVLELNRLPEHLIVLGGGYVGLELGQTYRRFGSKVTLVERGPRLAGQEDPDVSAELTRVLVGEGIEVLVGTEILQVEGHSGDQVTVHLRTSAGALAIHGTDILVATGRTPNTGGIGLEAAGIALDERDYIVVNERLETTAPDVWAMGESAGMPQFTHAAFDDFRIVRDNLAGGSRSTTSRLIPYCLFTDPPLGRVGLSENEARAQGISVRVARLPVSAVLRTRTTGETDGFMKVLVSADDDRILGFAMVGAEAGEVMAVVQTAMLADLPYPVLRDAILAHPTMSEGLGPLLSNVPARAGS